MAEAGNRESLSTDIVIVGAGPSGLAAAIRLKQRHPELSVTVVEKAAEVGGHILSGAVMDPIGLDALIPDWRLKGAPVGPDVTTDTYHFLTAQHDFAFPHALIPPQMKTPNGVIVSLGNLVRWLGEQAAELGVDIFPMTAAVDVLGSDKGPVRGIITGDLGRDHAGNPKPGFAEGIALEAKYTLIAEGARGSLAKKVIANHRLEREPQKYGLGIKEVWEIPADRHQPGKVDHYLGFPLDNGTAGGGFVYHAEDRKLYVGLVTYLDYKDPTLSPFDEFQRFKTHKAVAPLLEGATRISYGARTVTAGGWQSIPTLAFAGGGLIGCAAGFMNAPRLKAIHNAILSGIGAADAVADAIAKGRQHDIIKDLGHRVLATGIGRELQGVSNVKPLWSRLGTVVGAMAGGADLWWRAIFKTSLLGPLHHKHQDYVGLRHKGQRPARSYAKPDGKLTFDRTSSVYLANLAHDEDQPVHLKLADPAVPVRDNLPLYGEPAPLYCPAGVYEVAEEGGAPGFRIHAANCVHCKTCDIKDPAQNITWVPPEGGSGPNYSGM
ncbi:electron transfer flavoprotein-ubiquinone oxidoreductase [Devosia epidermidihirudinis]|uniref:Electron transfer flavoprotein-ubiquinone oxidoreductase n=1 Tax=Devosia epidermidihirudinis TaxID=1293439 RepID=A0A0F5QK13_9HYPH|nr:electron transfer flavoprotein-ubiquinone oxidoreductase [Devosia epidermidihirudinis]KKC41224.1 electron transfer flavoprotein-ubiquinone oxidoreductase [Devosia epidermidihirudinis]KKC41300.1 electron transfer flavoprotein-ubiquinone oxidoreductase [Devosia epidermidihirudinis]